MGVQLRYQYRVYPTPGQQNKLAQAFGCARMVYNDALDARKTAWRNGLPHPTGAELSKALTAMKRTPGRAWLNEVSSVILQSALADANTPPTATSSIHLMVSGRAVNSAHPAAEPYTTTGRPSALHATPALR